MQNNKIKYNELKWGWNLLPVLTWKMVFRNKQGNKFYSLVSLVRNIQETVLSAQDTLYRKTDSVKYYITLQAIWQQIWGGSLIDIYKILNPYLITNYNEEQYEIIVVDGRISFKKNIVLLAMVPRRAEGKRTC